MCKISSVGATWLVIDCPVSNLYDTTQHHTTRHNTIWHDTTQHKKTQNGIRYFFYFLKKKIFFLNFLKLFGKIFWTIFEEKKIFFWKIFCVFLCCVVSFTRHMCWVVSYRYDTTHLDSLVYTAVSNADLIRFKKWIKKTSINLG